MTIVQDLAEFVASKSFADLSESSVRELKIRILDALGCAIGAISGPPVKAIRKFWVDELGGNPSCTLVGGGRSSPDRAAFYNGALVRYLDYNDSFLAKGETCHPSDNIAPVLAGSEYARTTGREFLLSLGVAYQVQCRLSEAAPVRNKGFDHVTQGTYAVAAGVSKSLGLEKEKIANAIAISGTALNALRVTRTGRLSNWKGLAYPFMGQAALSATFLAQAGITGPLEVFEGNKGFMDAISGPFKVDWTKENLELVNKTILKKYNAEIHSQSAIECMLALRAGGLRAEMVDSIEVKIFDVAFNIIGGGEEGSKKTVSTKEEADHSLPYILASALIDGKVTPEQYTPERINSKDVQSLLERIHVVPSSEYSSAFPNSMPCEITVRRKDGKTTRETRQDYEGFFTRPMSWDAASRKFESLAIPFAGENLCKEIVTLLSKLESAKVEDLTSLLAQVKRGI